MSLAPVLKTAIGSLRSGRLEIEEDVKKAVIEPILRALGWDTADLRSIKSEYAAGPGRVDYALPMPCITPACLSSADTKMPKSIR